MEVVVIGPGALGRALGALLERGGAGVSAIGRSGPASRVPPAPDLVLVTVKAYDTAAAIGAAAPHVGGAAAFLSLQNGIGNVETIAAHVPPERVLGGSTTHAARRSVSGEALHIASGETSIAPLRPEAAPLARSVAAALTRHGLETGVAPDLRLLLWRKLAISAGVNALTALGGLTNGELLADREAYELARAAALEAAAVARALGIPLAPEGIPSLLEDVLRRTAANRSSMLQDLEAGRPTEVDAINGAIVRIARESGAGEAPVNARLARLLAERQGGAGVVRGAPSAPRPAPPPPRFTRERPDRHAR